MSTALGALGAAGRYVAGDTLIDGLPPPDRERLAERLVVDRAEVPDCVVSHGQPFEGVVFPSTPSSRSRPSCGSETCTSWRVGREGMIGAKLALGVDTAPRTVMSQVEGYYAQLPRESFTAFLGESRAFAQAVHRHMIRRLFIAEQFIACNFAHSVTERCARWVLMLADEAGRDRFGLRKDFLGMMLGLEGRAAQSAVTPLSKLGALVYADETMAIHDRSALLDVTCKCYEEQRRYAPVAA